MEILTTPQVAVRLGVTLARVQQMIWDGKLPAQKVGRDYVINESDLSLVADRKVGRPAKPKDELVSATGAAAVTATAATVTAEADATETKPERTRKAKAAKPKRAGKKAKAS